MLLGACSTKQVQLITTSDRQQHCLWKALLLKSQRYSTLKNWGLSHLSTPHARNKRQASFTTANRLPAEINIEDRPYGEHMHTHTQQTHTLSRITYQVNKSPHTWRGTAPVLRSLSIAPTSLPTLPVGHLFQADLSCRRLFQNMQPHSIS